MRLAFSERGNKIVFSSSPNIKLYIVFFVFSCKRKSYRNSLTISNPMLLKKCRLQYVYMIAYTYVQSYADLYTPIYNQSCADLYTLIYNQLLLC